MEINSNTKLTDIFQAYPWLSDELEQIDGRLKILKTPLGKMLIKDKTVADAVEKTGLPEEELKQRLQELILAHS